MKFNDAISLFSQSISIDASDRRFLVTLVDPEFTQDDFLIRLEISFLEDLAELQPGAQGGKFNSIKSGRLSAALLVDWSLLSEENSLAFLEFCKNWDPSQYYAKASKAERCVITGGVISGTLTEFTGPTGSSCAGLTRVSINGGKMAIGGGASREARSFIKKLLTTTANPKAADLLF